MFIYFNLNVETNKLINLHSTSFMHFVYNNAIIFIILFNTMCTDINFHCFIQIC